MRRLVFTILLGCVGLILGSAGRGVVQRASRTGGQPKRHEC